MDFKVCDVNDNNFLLFGNFIHQTGLKTQFYKSVSFQPRTLLLFTFTSVFLGAFLAHRFNLKLEMRKAKRQMRGDFCSLVSQIHLDFSEMIDFKKRYLDEIRKTYEEGNMNSFLVTKGFPCMSFILDIDKYIFLSDCNRCFLSELKIIKYNNNQLNNAWQDYMLTISDLADLLQNRDKDATKLMKEKFFKITPASSQFTFCNCSPKLTTIFATSIFITFYL